MKDFQVANTVFWCTFFVNQRGCDRKVLGPLFRQLISTNKSFFAGNSKTHARGFIADHDYMINSLVAGIDEFCKDWMASEAGEAWLIEIEKEKYLSLFL